MLITLSYLLLFAGLQKSLNDLKTYCTEWKLHVNCNKTKVNIFEKRKAMRQPMFLYSNEEFEIVEAFKYLGVVFNYNGTFDKCKMYVKD